MFFRHDVIIIVTVTDDVLKVNILFYVDMCERVTWICERDVRGYVLRDLRGYCLRDF